MCSLTFIPRDRGYYLAMNRDERIARRETIRPESVTLGVTSAIYPRAADGGTWIAANDAGITLALLNWNDVAVAEASKIRSRGSVIPQLIPLSTLQQMRTATNQMDLHGILPFRLIGIFATEQAICEWRWDLKKTRCQLHPWERRHWFSSSLSDSQATAQRGAVCDQAWCDAESGSLAWLRQLHASHANGPGPFSLCVHRKDVKTLSYTEFACTEDSIECRYFDGPPCEMLDKLAETKITRTGSVRFG
jgi:hypothetical protein